MHRTLTLACFVLSVLPAHMALAHDQPAPALLPSSSPSPSPSPSSSPSAPSAPSDFTLLRVDLEDGFALHPWIYHEFRFSEHWGLLGNVHAQTPGLNDRFPPFLEIDLGPVLHLGGLQINPQIGVDFTWESLPTGAHTRAGDFILELYLIFAWERLNAESWNLYFIPFDSATSQFYLMRQLLTVRVAGGFALGPHVEGAFVRGVGTDRIALGGDLAYTFKWGQLVLFLAAERMRGVLETRLTFVREL
jgi:hypothetical protein